jgi:nitroreductase
MSADNEVTRAITKRRSIRYYSKMPVPDEVVEKLIETGIHAPSALGLYPWSFIVVKDKEMMQKISDYAKPIVLEGLKNAKRVGMTQKYLDMVGEEGFSIFYNAPCLLLVLGKNDAPLADVDCSLCAQNIMLAAYSMGLGTCWIGSGRYLEKNPGLVEELGIPDEYHLVASLVLGYPAEKPEMPARPEPSVYWIK